MKKTEKIPNMICMQFFFPLSKKEKKTLSCGDTRISTPTLHSIKLELVPGTSETTFVQNGHFDGYFEWEQLPVTPKLSYTCTGR